MGKKICPACKKVSKTYKYILGWYFGFHETSMGAKCVMSNVDVIEAIKSSKNLPVIDRLKGVKDE